MESAMNLHNAHVVDFLQEARHWHDATLEADHWAALGDIAPIDAAMLLCRFNPNETSYEDAKLTTTDEMKPEHLLRLAQRLEDIDKADHKPRSLGDWHQTAKGLGLTYHSWIDGYMEATAPPVQTVADIAPPEPKAVVAEKPISVPNVNRGWTLKRAALIAKHVHHWPTIARDLQDASDNQLSKAAKATGHGDWFETEALKWAEQRGKLTDATGGALPVQATPLAGWMHKIKG